VTPQNDYLAKVRKRCDEVGALLLLDEIQTGIGRTGKLFGFENYNVVPDIIIAGKGLGGGMPIGAFIASKKLMDCLKEKPALGHITTFGGHPLIAAAALATLKEVATSNLMNESLRKEKLFRSLLTHPEVLEIRGKGLMLAALVKSSEIASQVILKCMDRGLLLFWLLFEGRAIRITPPLTISDNEIRLGCKTLLEVLDEVHSN
jgi:acetylornithine/succinyldiaminopimelate/putrescine aminotransferase